jgi:hypothetical protein
VRLWLFWACKASVHWAAALPVAILSVLFFAFLFKGFFIHDTHDRTGLIPVTDEDHPELHEFVERLCDEIGAPLPHRICVSPEVNAAVMYRLSLINLIVHVLPSINDAVTHWPTHPAYGQVSDRLAARFVLRYRSALTPPQGGSRLLSKPHSRCAFCHCGKRRPRQRRPYCLKYLECTKIPKFFRR